MRRLTILVLAALACACATPAERAAQMQREVDDMMQVYGPGCEKLGYKPDTDPWRDCVLRLATRDSFERYGAYSRSPVMTSCWGHHGFFNCSTF